MSPIIGLTDASPSFKEIGRLRKGAPKAQGLSDLKYFRPDFRPDEQAAGDLFRQVYGDQPTMINIRLAFAEIDRCWDAWYTVYNTSGMLGMADGAQWVYLRDNKSGQIVVKDGQPAMAFDASIPVYSYTNKKGVDTAVYARPEGKLRVLVPELKRANYLTLVTHSYYDIANISKQLAAIDEMAKRMGLRLPMVPLTLTRRPEVVSCKLPNGGKNLQEKWIVNIDIRADWAEAQFALLEDVRPGLALPAPKLFELPAGVPEPEEWAEEEEHESEPVGLLPPAPAPATTPEPEKKPDPAPQVSSNGSRPYAPETLRTKLTAKASSYGPTVKVTEKQRSLLAILLSEAVAGNELERHAIQDYLYGHASMKDVPAGLILASLNDWLKPVQDSGGAYKPEQMAVAELYQVYREALKLQGQQDFYWEVSCEQESQGQIQRRRHQTRFGSDRGLDLPGDHIRIMPGLGDVAAGVIMVTTLTIPLPAEDIMRANLVAQIAELTGDADERTTVTDCIQITTPDYNLAQKIKNYAEFFKGRTQ